MSSCRRATLFAGRARRGRRPVTATCQIGIPGAGAIIRTDVRLGLRDTSGLAAGADLEAADESEAPTVAVATQTRWGDAVRPRRSQELSVTAELPSHLPPERVDATFEFTAIHGRWWVTTPPLTVRRRGERRTIRWEDKVFDGRVTLVPREGAPGTLTVRVAARLREPDLLQGMPLVVLGVDLLSASGDPLVSTHLVFIDRETPPHGRYQSEVVEVAADAWPVGAASLRLRFGVGTHGTRKTGALERVPGAGRSHASTRPSTHSTTHLERVRYRERCGFSNRWDDGDEWPWDAGDRWDGVPRRSATIPVFFCFKQWESGDAERLTDAERADPARISYLSGPLHSDLDGLFDGELDGARVLAIDVIWDGVTYVPEVSATQVDWDEDRLPTLGPLLQFHLSRRVPVDAFVSAITSQCTFGLSPASNAAGEDSFVAADHNGYTHAVSAAYVARWRAALWYGGGYLGRSAVNPDELLGGMDDHVRQQPLSAFFTWARPRCSRELPAQS